MSKILNIDTDIYNQVVEYPLDSIVYQIHCYWNSRSKAWYLGVYDDELFNGSTEESEEALIYSRRVMPNQDLFSDVVMENLPKGVLLCIDTEGLKDDEIEPEITLTNLGYRNRFKLIYYPEEEAQELGLI